MNSKLSKILLTIFLPLSFSIMVIGVGFSAWSFSNNEDTLSKGINIETSGLGTMAYLVRNYDPSSKVDDTQNKNYIVASDSEISFLRTYYIHFIKGDNLPVEGTIHFPFTLSIRTPIVSIDSEASDLMVKEGIISEATNGMHIGQMIYTRFYCALACDYNESSCVYNTVVNEVPFDNEDAFDIDKSELNSGYLTFKLKKTDDTQFYWKHGVDLNSTNIPSHFYIQSNLQIYMSYSDIYNKLMASNSSKSEFNVGTVTYNLKDYIVEKARYILSNTTLTITYGLEYSKETKGNYCQ